VVDRADSALFVDQNNGGIGRAASHRPIVQVFAPYGIWVQILDPGPGYIDLPPGLVQLPAVNGIGVLPQVQGYYLDIGV